MSVAPTPTTISVNLRFKRTDADKLRRIADRAMVKDLNADVQLYRDAAVAAEHGDPFPIICHDREDLYVLVAGLVANGVDQPAIEAARG
jgi:hypothetical protein